MGFVNSREYDAWVCQVGFINIILIFSLFQLCWYRRMVGRHMETSPSKFVTIRLFLGSLDLVSVPCKRKACLMLKMLIYLHLLYPFFDRFPKTYLYKVCARFYLVHSSTSHLTLTFSGLADI